MEIKGLKENIQGEKGNMEHWKLDQNSTKLTQARTLQRNSPKAHLGEHCGEVRQDVT